MKTPLNGRGNLPLTRAIAHGHGVHLYAPNGRHTAIRFGRGHVETTPDFCPAPRRIYYVPPVGTPVLPANFALRHA